MELDEMKKLVEAEENGEIENLDEEAEIVEQRDDDAPEEEVEQEAEADDGTKEEPEEVEAWMKSEEEPEAKYTDSDAAAIRRKWKAKVSEKEDEIEALRREVETLKKTPQQQQVLQNEPKQEDFDTDAEYFKALAEYQVKLVTQKHQSELSAAEKKRQFDEQNAKVQQAVDLHYARAQDLAKKSNIKPESYQLADKNVRLAIDSVFPKGGDAVTDALISSLGEGSEKVFYHVGVNSAKRTELVNLLKDDPSGIKAAVYLGKLNATLTMPAKRETKAPEPVDEIQGDKKSGNNSITKMKKEFNEVASKEPQKAFEILRKAKAAGADISGWQK